MRSQRRARQSDLFDNQPDLFDIAPGAEEEDPDLPELVARIREELVDTLARVKAAETPPWSDLTQTTLGELRFHSLARTYLPAAEAEAMRAEFEAEMLRLYKAIGEA
jgi:hypothetical protein